jgi:hypothetical protein
MGVFNNEVKERAWYNGTPSNKLIFELGRDVRHETLIGNFTLHVVHVAGMRMIEEGTDALSRGEIHAHDLMNEYAHSVPLDRTALQRVPAILDWVKYVCGDTISVATSEQWFEEATQQFDYLGTPKTWIWDLAPATAIYAIEELGIGRNKRLDVLQGIVLVPRLMRPEWYR